jgi:hypothetical protein
MLKYLGICVGIYLGNNVYRNGHARTVTGTATANGDLETIATVSIDVLDVSRPEYNTTVITGL